MVRALRPADRSEPRSLCGLCGWVFVSLHHKLFWAWVHWALARPVLGCEQWCLSTDQDRRSFAGSAGATRGRGQHSHHHAVRQHQRVAVTVLGTCGCWCWRQGVQVRHRTVVMGVQGRWKTLVGRGGGGEGGGGGGGVYRWCREPGVGTSVQSEFKIFIIIVQKGISVKLYSQIRCYRL